MARQTDLIAAEELLRLEEGGGPGGDAAGVPDNPLDALRQVRSPAPGHCVCQGQAPVRQPCKESCTGWGVSELSEQGGSAEGPLAADRPASHC